MLQGELAQLNSEFWAQGEFVDHYATRELRAVEKVMLERFRGALAGTVLELGCGAGRLTGHLSSLAREVHGVDVSPAMVDYCRRAYPEAMFSTCDMRDLSGLERGAYEVVLAPYNVLDILGDYDRRQVLREIRALLVDGGLLMMSSHNRAYAPLLRSRMRLLIGSPRRPVWSARRLPLRLRNRRRLRARQHASAGYAIRNDEAHDFSLLHYYISRDAQEHQLYEHGYQLLECLDLDGRKVDRGAHAHRCPELHYIARR